MTAQVQTQDAMHDYLRSIGRRKMLTGDQEISLGRQVQSGVAIAHRLQELHELEKTPTIAQCLTFELTAEEKATLRQAKRAQDKMVQANLRLVVSVAKKYKNSEVELLDMIQEGSLGLIRATEKFDPAKGYKFSTYAHWWIRQALTRTRSNQSRAIRLPVHVHEKLAKIKAESRSFLIKNGRMPTTLELSDLVEISPEALSTLRQNTRTVYSLDVRINRDDGRDRSSVLDFQAFEGAEPIEDAILMEQKQAVERYLEALDERSQYVVKLRFGIGDRDHTLSEIGAYMGVTRERVRQIQSKAMRTLRVLASRDAIELTDFLVKA